MNLLLLHGFTGAPSSFRRVLDALPSGWRVWLPRLAGHVGASFVGETGGPLEAVDAPDDGCAPTSFVQHVDQLLTWAQRHGFGQGNVAGYSLGARLALGLLVQDQRVASRACLIGVHPGLADDVACAERRRLDLARINDLEQGGVEAFVASWEMLPLFETQRAVAAELLDEQRAVRLSHSATGLALSLRTCGLGQMPNHRPELARLDLPVALVVGEHDAKFAALAVEMLAFLPDARLFVVPACGHNPVLERPAEVARIIAGAPPLSRTHP